HDHRLHSGVFEHRWPHGLWDSVAIEPERSGPLSPLFRFLPGDFRLAYLCHHSLEHAFASARENPQTTFKIGAQRNTRREARCEPTHTRTDSAVMARHV